MSVKAKSASPRDRETRPWSSSLAARPTETLAPQRVGLKPALFSISVRSLARWGARWSEDKVEASVES
jgi:hypothetical protein